MFIFILSYKLLLLLFLFIKHISKILNHYFKDVFPVIVIPVVVVIIEVVVDVHDGVDGEEDEGEEGEGVESCLCRTTITGSSLKSSHNYSHKFSMFLIKPDSKDDD